MCPMSLHIPKVCSKRNFCNYKSRVFFCNYKSCILAMPLLQRYRLTAAVKLLVVLRAETENANQGRFVNQGDFLRMPRRAWFEDLLFNLRFIGAVPHGASTTVETLRSVVRQAWRTHFPQQHPRRTRVRLDRDAKESILLRAEAWTDEYRGGDKNSAPPKAVCKELCDFLKAEGVIPSPSTVNAESIRTVIRMGWGLKQ